jgi:two-component system OmpR family response regulator
MILLMVDDDPAIRELFSLFITRQGNTPHTAANGGECISLLETLKPDVIMLDIMMLPMDGWDTLSAIRANPETRDLPVTMFSGKPPAPSDLQQFACRIDDYLMKPLDFKNLSTILADILERSSRRQDEVRILKMTSSDPVLVNEYDALMKSIYIYRKFSRSSRNGEYETAIRIQEERLRQIWNTLLPGSAR